MLLSHFLYKIVKGTHEPKLQTNKNRNTLSGRGKRYTEVFQPGPEGLTYSIISFTHRQHLLKDTTTAMNTAQGQTTLLEKIV